MIPLPLFKYKQVLSKESESKIGRGKKRETMERGI